jgi:hypothetical protein
MDIKSKKMYSEVYSILNLLGSNYIKKIPTSLYNMIQTERLETYNPIYNSAIALEQQNIQRETLSMIALLHLKYWCDSDDEKKALTELFNKNYEKYQAELRKKYNPDNLFNKNDQIVKDKHMDQPNIQLVENKEKNIFNKIINNIINFFKNSN